MLGCDYSDKIKGIGPKRALELIHKHGSMEKILSNLDKEKYTVPEHFPYQEIRNYFKNPDSTPSADLDVCLTPTHTSFPFLSHFVTLGGFVTFFVS